MKILVCAHDPGGISAVSSVIEELEKKDHQVVTYSAGDGVKRFNEQGIFCKTIPEEVIAKSEMMESWLKDNEIDGVLTGTSSYNEIERLLWKASKEIGIKSHAILDYWFNLSIRFHCNPVKTIDYNYEIECTPDYIYVVDEYVYTELVELGIHSSQIVISGHPKLFEYYTEAKCRQWNEEPYKKIRYILYSEQINDLYNSMEKWGFDEYSVMDIIFDAVAKCSLEIEVMIKPHPKQHLDLSQIDKMSAKYKVDYEIIRNKVTVRKCDVVMGTFTMAIVEAVIKGERVINIIPSIMANKYSILAVRKLLNPIKSSDELLEFCENNEEIIEIEKEFHLKESPGLEIATRMEVEYERSGD